MSFLTGPYRADVQFALVVAIAILAWFRGSSPERWSAGTLAAMFIVDRIYHFFVGPTGALTTVDMWHFALDAVVLAAFVAIGLRANRMYPLALAGFQLVAVNAHFVRGTIEVISPIAYYVLYVGPSYFQLIIVTIGLVMHVRRERRFGSYRDWRQVPVTG